MLRDIGERACVCVHGGFLGFFSIYIALVCSFWWNVMGEEVSRRREGKAMGNFFGSLFLGQIVKSNGALSMKRQDGNCAV